MGPQPGREGVTFFRRSGSQLVINATRKLGAQRAPGGGLGKENVAVGHPHLAVGEQELVQLADRGIVISRKQGDPRHAAAKKLQKPCKFVRGEVALGVAGVAIEYQVVHPRKKGGELLRIPDTAVRIEDMQIGKDAQHLKRVWLSDRRAGHP